MTAKTIDTVCLLLNCQPNNIKQVVREAPEKKSIDEKTEEPAQDFSDVPFMN